MNCERCKDMTEKLDEIRKLCEGKADGYRGVARNNEGEYGSGQESVADMVLEILTHGKREYRHARL